jgi:hypothetical protein
MEKEQKTDVHLYRYWYLGSLQLTLLITVTNILPIRIRIILANPHFYMV